jgi:hypothetical protein
MPPNSSDVLRYSPPRNLKLVGIAAVGIAAVVVGVGVASRLHANREAQEATKAQTETTVTLVAAKADNAAANLTLPARLEA